ncbi:hypothetical protein [Chryseobacterium sp. JM1]|uniref:hypothetical protein n=1 Tax=Chryseobacterium sp. JM1 TaxID=1233950 RepID=UPI0004E72DD1|nr:hypothetical protein [Chryseobacterium sp. JM1]KFF20488.1 hypothetical protein IW22_12650 [Chryseobacterium sp. JM1]
MNPRVLELLKNPKNIQSEDLGLLKEEIHAFPYVQNIRALHLFGVHLYDKENYQKELSTTAAYTTDKKLLYQLINGKIQREPKPETAEEKQPSKTTEKAVKYSYKDKAFPIKREEPTDKKQDQYEAAASMIPPAQEIKHIHVNGERNRILFEGEENFLDETHSEVIDLESTLESGVIVTQKTEPVTEDLKEESVQEVGAENNEPSEDSEAGVEFTPELIVDEDQIDEPAEEQEIDNEEEVSFHEVEAIVPETEVTEEAEEQKETVEEPVAIEAEENSEVITEVENTDEPHAEISFHGMDEFLPDVKIQANSDDEAVAPEVSKPNVNKHEEEMRRLIEEVEKKMKEAQSAPKVDNEEPETADHEISFAETQNFHFWSTEKEEPKTTEESAPEKEEETTEQPIQNEEPEVIVEKPEEQKIVAQEVSAWKPMSLESNVPDSMISKEQTVPAPKTEAPKQENIPVVEEKQEEVAAEMTEEPQKEAEKVSEQQVAPVAEETPETAEEQHTDGKASEEVTETKTPKGEEAPVMNVSFFGSDISSLSVEKREKENIQADEPVQEVKAQNTAQTPSDSNVPGFINTWQSWLKIDRPAEEEVVVQKEEVEEVIPIQEKVIEAFIENNPKISQLRDESTYVVREKNDDISHLMTETLANLYLEQKLYSKAIKAFGILKKKYPERVAYFDSRIEEVNIIKSGK